MRPSRSNALPGLREERDHLGLLADHFRQNGWRVKVSPSVGGRSATLLFRANASAESAVPLAIVAAPVISPSVAVGLMRFLADFMPDAAAGTIDNEGLLHFVGPGLERLNSAPPRLARRRKLVPSDSTYLFSDLKHLKGDTQPPKVWTGIFRDTFADAQCARFYADDIGGPALAPECYSHNHRR